MNDLFRYISETKIWGFIPLDLVLHFTLSYGIFLILILKKVRYIYAYLVIVFLELSKEIYDSSVMTNTIRENIVDFSVTMILPTLLLLVVYLKKGKI